jgi:hypothetical protein
VPSTKKYYSTNSPIFDWFSCRYEVFEVTE